MDIRKYIYNNRWTIGLSLTPLDTIINSDDWSINWVSNPYRNRWFADPFILDIDNDYIYVLVEEYYDPIDRGRISRLTIDLKTNRIINIDVVLELPTHLSFPAIMRKNNKVYIYPENSADSILNLYEYDPNTNKCVLFESLSNEKLADAIITNLFGKELMFATSSPNHNGSILNVYERDGGKIFNKIGNISFDMEIARNAGDFFMLNGKLFRPAQDCSEVYGGAVIIQEITKDDKGFHFKNVKRLDCTPSNYTLGFHTFNYYKGMAVFDANGLRRPKLARIIRIIRKIINR